MFLMQYRHRLPQDYDMDVIRARAAKRGNLWNDAEGLAFKAFLIQDTDAGHVANTYSSFYAWNREEAAMKFLFSENFQNVTEAFGRPLIETWIGLIARRGPAHHAATFIREDVDVAVGTPLKDVLFTELALADDALEQDETAAYVSGIDVATWRIVRVRLIEGPPPKPGTWEPGTCEPGTCEPGASAPETKQAFDIAYLAKPTFDKLPD